MNNSEKLRCQWAQKEIFHQYHDNEWGIPVYDDNQLFEMLCLEGAQAGLSWQTILVKRNNYKKLFNNFEINKVAVMSENKLQTILTNPGIVRNRLKVFSVVKNANCVVNIQKQFGSFSNYIWSFTDKKIIDNQINHINDIPTQSDLSHKISKDMKKRGMSFVGGTIMYSYLQAIGVINDHQVDCFRYNQIKNCS